MIYTKNYLTNLTHNGRGQVLDALKDDFAGSSIFTKNKTMISKLISGVTKGRSKLKGFIPSHVGSIFMLDGILYVFNMVPPRAYIMRLDEFLITTDSEYQIVLRDFELDIEMFSRNIFARDGEDYGEISAVASAFKWWDCKDGKEHCSEIQTVEVQKQGQLLDMVANETVPVELYERLILGESYHDYPKKKRKAKAV